MTVLEDRLHNALFEGTAAVEESPDLFARVRLSIDDDRRLRRQHRRAIAIIGCVTGALAALVAAVTDYRQGELLMDWWVLELLTTAFLMSLALWLGPLIKRFGKSYAADVFRANPRTGKSFIVLTDIAYYLIFFAYILFTVSFQPKGNWGQTVTAPRERPMPRMSPATPVTTATTTPIATSRATTISMAAASGPSAFGRAGRRLGRASLFEMAVQREEAPHHG